MEELFNGIGSRLCGVLGVPHDWWRRHGRLVPHLNLPTPPWSSYSIWYSTVGTGWHSFAQATEDLGVRYGLDEFPPVSPLLVTLHRVWVQDRCALSACSWQLDWLLLLFRQDSGDSLSASRKVQAFLLSSRPHHKPIWALQVS